MALICYQPSAVLHRSWSRSYLRWHVKTSNTASSTNGFRFSNTGTDTETLMCTTNTARCHHISMIISPSAPHTIND